MPIKKTFLTGDKTDLESLEMWPKNIGTNKTDKFLGLTLLTFYKLSHMEKISVKNKNTKNATAKKKYFWEH